jgi:hypothetical protein
MKDSTLETLAPLLGVLRSYPVLNEVRPAAFHLDGGDFIHFHEEPEGLFADARLGRGRVRLPVSTQAEQAELLERIEEKLSSLESHSSSKRQKRKRKH